MECVNQQEIEIFSVWIGLWLSAIKCKPDLVEVLIDVEVVAEDVVSSVDRNLVDISVDGDMLPDVAHD